MTTDRAANIFAWSIVGLCAIVWLSLVCGIGYIIAHFVIKYW